jgi:hypothetical protein
VYSWDKTTGQWVLYTKGEGTYDDNGNCTLYISYEWELTTSQWIVFGEREYAYDAYGNQTMMIAYESDKTTIRLIPVVKNIGYYSEHDFIPKTPEEIIYAYPNPASEYFLFDLANLSEPSIVEIFDNQGRKVLEQDISENRQISVSNLAHGLYLYRLNYSGTIYNGKIVVINKIQY